MDPKEAVKRVDPEEKEKEDLREAKDHLALALAVVEALGLAEVDQV